MNPVEALSPEGLAELLAHPRLTACGDAVARAHAEALSGMDAETRWLTADVGRAALCASLLILDALGAASAVSLITTAAAYGFCSRGRVMSFLHYAQARGRISVPSGHEPWTQRRLTVSASFETPFRRMTQLRLRAMAMVAPELDRVADRLDDPVAHRALVAATGLLMNSAPAIFAGPPTPITLFLQRDGGMDILRDLTASQPADRARYLDSAPLSRLALARRNNVSRTQVTRVLQDAEAAGLLTAGKDRIDFSPALSDDALRHLAFTTQSVRLASAAAGLVA
jgi:hypothetical protein